LTESVPKITGSLTFMPEARTAIKKTQMNSQEWWECLRIATRKYYRFELEDLYPDPEKLGWAVKASAYIQVVTAKMSRKRSKMHDTLGHREGPTSLEDAIQECLKYCTKVDEIACYVPDPERPGEMMISGLPTDYLRREILRRSPRTFATLGAARSNWEMPEWCEPASGVSPELMAELTGEATRAAAKAAREASSCLLDTPQINDGEGSGELARRPPTLRKLMLTMDLHRWLQIAAARASSSLEFLQDALQKKGYWIPEPMLKQEATATAA